MLASAREDLPVLPVIADERASGVRTLLASLQARHAEIEAEAPPRKKYQPRPWWRQLLRDLRQRGPGWAASMAGHALALFLLAQVVWFIRNPDAVRSILISLSSDEAPVAGDAAQPEADGADDSAEPEAPPAPEPEPEPSEPAEAAGAAEDAAAEEPAPSAEDAAREAAAPASDAAGGEAGAGTVAPEVDPSRPKAFQNRAGSGKAVALNKFGGSSETEAAVEMGLRWLAAHQHSDGRWSGAHFTQRCPGALGGWAGRSVSGAVQANLPCAGAGQGGNDVAQTSLALLCFLGAGHLPKSKPYGDQVRLAIQFLTRSQRPDGGFLPPGNHACMYNHGAVTLALCEAAALTNDPAVKRTAQRAVDYLVSAQRSSGGWDYTGAGLRTRRSDMSVSGWAIMAMKSAVVADLQLSRRSWDRVKKYVRASQRRDGLYCYDNGRGNYSQSMTAIGLACDLFLGTDPAEGRLGLAADRVVAEPPNWKRVESGGRHTFYYWYYGTLALFQVGGERWQAWNAAMRTALVDHQRRDGHAAGSWDPKSPWIGRSGGRVLVTAMNVLTLEVYYRYLPVYRDTNEGGDPDDDGGPPRTGPGPGRYRVGDVADAITKSQAEAPAMRAAALERLKDVRTAAAFDVIARGLRDKKQMVRYAAVRALQARKESDATMLLLRALATESRDMRRVITRALGRRGDRSAVPALIDLLRDQDTQLRGVAQRSLEQLTQQKFGTDQRAWRRWWARDRRK
ncbi:MAG: HEAT repeat domain-containing protein [Planctomycetota bacterium]